MKKVIAGIILAVFAVFAAPPTTSSSVVYKVAQGLVVPTDTLASTDSIVVANRIGGNSKQLMLVYAAPTGHADSTKIQVVVDALDNDGAFLFRTVVDSIQTTGDIVDLSTLPALNYTVKLKGYTGNKLGGTIINKMSILERTIVQ